jgi:hypothetical protein
MDEALSEEPSDGKSVSDDISATLNNIDGASEGETEAPIEDSQPADVADLQANVAEEPAQEIDESAALPQEDNAVSEDVPSDETKGESDDVDLAEMEAMLDMSGLMDEEPSEENKEENSEGAPDEAPEEIAGEVAQEAAEEELNLDDLEASLDDLLSSEEGSGSADGEVAEVESAAGATDGETASEEGDVAVPDLDALMNSLANDEVEDIENTSHLDEEAGRSEDSEIPKEDILDALTEEGFNDGGEPSLDELASIPERGGDGEDSDDASDKKGKKKKKEGFFARLLKALTKEDDDSAEGLASLTDENQQVLNELGEEGKGKKEKKKKEKKPKKEKPKKEKPPKKEKKPKPPKDPGVPEKAIAPKKVAICAIFAASLGILFVIPSMVIPDSVTSTRASNAYKQREYTTAYKLLYGKERTEEQDNIYEQSRVLAWAERYLNGYENYIAMNMEEEALDMLLMAMRNHDDLLEEAAKYGVEVQVQSVYDSIESLLSANYGLGADDIAEINSIKKERDYTIRIMEIVGTLES